jgi:hypothetical protein
MNKKYIFTLVTILLLNISSQNIEAQNRIFGYPVAPGFAVVIDDKLVFYELRQSEFIKIPELEFVIPNDYTNIFIFNYYSIIVVVDNKLKIYEFIRESRFYNLSNYEINAWNEIWEIEITFPIDFNNIFAFSPGIIGIAYDNKVIFYSIGPPRGLNEMPAQEFNIPFSYSNIIGFSNATLAVVVENNVKFFQSRRDGYFEIRTFEFALPDGYVDIFEFKFGLLGVLFNNIIKIYEFRENNWVLTEYKLDL